MSDSADLVCFGCKLVLPIGMFRRGAEPRRLFLPGRLSQDDVPTTQAVWKFLAEHVYHRVELLGEGDEDRWNTVNRDFATVDGDRPGDPTLAEYLGHWPGGALAQHPRPMAEAVAPVVHEGSSSALRRSLGPADTGIVRALHRATRWPEDPGTEVDDDALAVRLAKLRTGLDALHTAAARSSDPELAKPLKECVRILAPARDLTQAALRQNRDAYAPPTLFDAERALGLIHDWTWWTADQDDVFDRFALRLP